MKPVLTIFILLSVILISDILLYYLYKISLAGYYSDVILFWLWFISCMLVIVKFWQKRFAKIVLGAMITVLILSVLPLAIPFISFLLSMTPAGIYYDKNLNENYRAQIVRYDGLANPHLEIIKSKGLLEERKMVLSDFDMIDLYPGFRLSQTEEIFLENECASILSVKILQESSMLKVTFDKNSGKIITIK